MSCNFAALIKSSVLFNKETMFQDTKDVIGQNKRGDVYFGSISVFANPSVLA